MIKSLKTLFVTAVLITLISSCSKTDNSYPTILTAHKWSMTANTETYSDSGSISHNLMYSSPTCPTTSYLQFYNYGNNSSVRLYNTYITTQCAGNLPNISTAAWDIDKDNQNLYLNGSTTGGTNGTWFKITTLDGSSMVLTTSRQRAMYNGTTTVTDIATNTMTFTAQ